MKVTRDQALGLAECHIRTGIPMHPRGYRAMRETIGETTAEEEAVFAALRRAREFEDATPLHWSRGAH